MFGSRFMPCPDCGDAIEAHESEQHHCRPERLAEYQMFALRERIAAFEDELQVYLDTPAGDFERWLAARQVRREH